MTPNHKLTNVIKGRKIVETSNAAGKMIVTFDDGSTMKIKSDDVTNHVTTDSITDVTTGKVAVAQSSTRLDENATASPSETVTTSTASSATATNLVSTNVNSTNLKPTELLPSPGDKRNDVFRNLKWSEEKSQSDASHLNARVDDSKFDKPEIGLARAEVATDAVKSDAVQDSATSVNAASGNVASAGGTVKSCWQNETTLKLQFEDGGALEISLQEESSSVMLRDKNNVMEYAD